LLRHDKTSSGEKFRKEPNAIAINLAGEQFFRRCQNRLRSNLATTILVG